MCLPRILNHAFPPAPMTTDLVPREVGEKWLKYFREELPTVAFKCSTQAQSTNISQRRMPKAKKEVAEQDALKVCIRFPADDSNQKNQNRQYLHFICMESIV